MILWLLACGGVPASVTEITPVSPDAWCHPPRSLAKVLHLRVFRGTGVSPEDTAGILAPGLGYWRDHGLNITVSDGGELPLRYALTGRVDDELPPDEGARSLLQPVRQTLASTASPSAARVNIIILQQLLDPQSSANQVFNHLNGMPFSAHADPDLLSAVDMTPPFTPTIFVSTEQQRPDAIPLTVAHELGHALGLTHQNGSDLMNPRPQQCAPPLSEPQQHALTFPGFREAAPH